MADIDQEVVQLIKQTEDLRWDGNPLVVIRDVEDAKSLARMILVGKIISKRIVSLLVVHGTLEKAWDFEANLEVQELATNIFFFGFSSSAARNRVLERRPWNVK